MTKLRLVPVVKTYTPRLVLAEGDARRAPRVHRVLRPVSSGLRSPFPIAHNLGSLVLNRQDHPTIVEFIGAVFVWRSIFISPLDVDDIYLSWRARVPKVIKSHVF